MNCRKDVSHLITLVTLNHIMAKTLNPCWEQGPPQEGYGEVYLRCAAGVAGSSRRDVNVHRPGRSTPSSSPHHAEIPPVPPCCAAGGAAGTVLTARQGCSAAPEQRKSRSHPLGGCKKPEGLLVHRWVGAPGPAPCSEVQGLQNLCRGRTSARLVLAAPLLSSELPNGCKWRFGSHSPQETPQKDRSHGHPGKSSTTCTDIIAGTRDRFENQVSGK